MGAGWHRTRPNPALQRTRPAAAVSDIIDTHSRRAGPLSCCVRQRASVTSTEAILPD
jgi:hypothetical protein